MLSPAEAEARLKEFLVPSEDKYSNPTDRFQARIEKLPKKLQPAALKLADLFKDALPNPDGRADFQAICADEFGGLAKADRDKILKTFFGSFAAAIELTWDWLSTQPSRAMSGGSFRSPSHPEHSLGDRYDWLKTMVRLAGYLKDGTLDVAWAATWAAHLKFNYHSFDGKLGMVFAAIIDNGSKADADLVFDILSKSLTKEHEIGCMGRHIPVAFFRSQKEEAWELMEKTLLAAQRQEGLRQVLLSCAQHAHPRAITRLLALIIDQGLLRFSSVVQALDQWFDLAWSSLGAKKLEEAAKKALAVLQDPKERKRIFKSNDAEAIYFALWAEATEDVSKSIVFAQDLIKSKQVEIRYVTALHLTQLPKDLAGKARTQAIYDQDLRVAIAALYGSNVGNYYGRSFSSPDLFEALEDLIVRLQAKQEITEIVWPWTSVTLERKWVGSLLENAIEDRPLVRLIPYFQFLESWTRASIVKKFGKVEEWDQETRNLMLDFLGDRSADVSAAAATILKKRKLQSDEAPKVESYLTRTGAELRKNIINLLIDLSDDHVLASAERLLGAAKQQRLAGLELLRKMSEEDRSKVQVMQTAADWMEGRKLLKAEQVQIDSILDSNREAVTLDNGFGLFDPTLSSPTVAPEKQKVQPYTKTIPKILKSLDDLIHSNREQSVTYEHWNREVTELLGNINWGFPTPRTDQPIAKQIKRLPLLELWQDWYDQRAKSLRDDDGCELLRAHHYLESVDYHGRPAQLKYWSEQETGYTPLCKYFGYDQPVPELRYRRIVSALLEWLLSLNPPKATSDFLLDVYETALAMLPASSKEKLSEPIPEDLAYGNNRNQIVDWRHLGVLSYWRIQNRFDCRKLDKKQLKRAWQLEHWRDIPNPGANRDLPSIPLLAAAYSNGFANLTDVATHLVGPRQRTRYGSSFDSLRSTTQRQIESHLIEFVKREEVSKLINAIRDRVLEVELERGEAATAASEAALAIGAFEGIDVLLRLLKALGKDGFKKNRGYRTATHDSKAATLTEMVSNTFPAVDETHQDFTTKVRRAIAEGEFPEERLLQLAFLAPQWIPYVEVAISWEGFGEGILWYLAHMGHIWEITRAFESEAIESEVEIGELEVETDQDELEMTPQNKPEKLSRFERLIRERTSLNREEREQGAIDVPWFHRTYELLTPDRFEALAAAAKFATTTQAAKKAQYVADVLLGKIPKSDLVDAIRKKNLKEKVRLLGLLPLDKMKTQADILDRYEVLQEYLRYAKKLSSMSRPDAIRSYEIAMQNLASTAGFVDPIRLQWTLEAASTKDLATGPVVVHKGDVSLTLELNQDAKPIMTIRRGDKELKSLPKSVHKEEAFVELRERNKHLKRQVSRVKQSLEQAMLKQDLFTGQELTELADHAILWPQLSRLILIGEGIMGYPVKAGKGLMDHQGKIEPVKKKEQLRIAHSYDLLKSKQWSLWQKECFQQERLQPFKQIFRELYVVTAQEKKDKNFSARYAGQQVNPRQAYALWGNRGWSVDEYSGVFKAFPEHDLVVDVSFNFGFTTPLEVEGLTIENLNFRSRKEYQSIPVAKVDPILFSEIMRDMDLVVSVAHVGDVDPEASASTVEMRDNLLQETCKLLGIKNVKVKGNHALIKGTLAEYSVHLGSGVVHCQPGGAVCLVPIHSQHRGRLFLPFADDDPRTAEVISKTLLLAKDEDIQDPIILDQLRSMA